MVSRREALLLGTSSVIALASSRTHAQELSASALDHDLALFYQNSHTNEVFEDSSISDELPDHGSASYVGTDYTELDELNLQLEHSSRLDLLREFAPECEAALRSIGTEDVVEEFSSALSKLELSTEEKESSKADIETYWPSAEVLVDRASDLFDRAMAMRAQWDDLSARHLSDCLEVVEFFAMEEVHDREIAHGFYKRDAVNAFSARDAGQTQTSAEENKLKFQKDTINAFHSDAVLRELRFYGQSSAWALTLPNNNITRHTFDGVDWRTNSPKKYTGTINGFVSHAARQTTGINLLKQKRSAELEKIAFKYNNEVSSAKLAGLENEAQWQTHNGKFRRERATIERNRFEHRLSSMLDPSGALNNKKRLAGLKKRISDDFEAGVKMLPTIHFGLQTLYDFSVRLPELGEIDGSKRTVDDYFDECVRWLRQAVQWTLESLEHDQDFRLSFSLRKVESEQQTMSALWGNNGFVLSQKTIEERLNIEKIYRHRIRGISVFIEGLDNGWGSIEIEAPTKFKYYTEKESKLVATIIENQRPQTSYIDAAFSRALQIGHEIVGTKSLFNYPVLGDWKIRLTDVYPDIQDFSKVEDVVVTFHVAGQTR